MNKRTCPDCRGNSYSSYSGGGWDCPYCGKDLSHVPDKPFDASNDSVTEKPMEKSRLKLYSISGGKLALDE